MELIINDTKVVFTKKDNGVFTDTLAIAKVFGKEHKHILETIRNTGLLEDVEYSRKFDPITYVASKGK